MTSTKNPPEPDRKFGSGGVMSRSEVRNNVTSPSSPAAIRAAAAAQSGSNRRWKPTCSGTPAASTASIVATVVARSSESGFSQNTGRPACAAVTVSSACEPVGVATATASERSTSSANVVAAGTPYSAATAAARSPSAS